MKVGLQTKLLTPTLATVILTMGLSSYFSYRKASEEIWNELVNSSQNIAHSVSKGLTIYVEDLQAITLTQSRTVRIGAMFASPDPPEETKLAAVKSLIELKEFDSSIQAANILNAKGDTILSTDPQASGNFSDREYFKRAMKGEANVSEPFMSRATGKPVFSVAAPVKSGDKVVGVLYARVDLAGFTDDMIVPVKVGQTGYAYMVDKTGLIFSHPDKERILKQNISEQDWGKKVLSQGKGVISYDSQGIQKTAIFTKEKTTGWTVAVTVNNEDIARASASVRNTTLAFGGAGIILISLIIYLILHQVIKDLAANVDFAGAVAEGNLDRKLEITRHDELGKLSQSLKTMVEKLKEMIETSNRKTKEAEEQTEVARKAMAQAEEAQEKCAKATQEGMLAAAAKLEGVVAIVSSASEELSSQVEESSRGTEEQARRTDETATAMEEMNATVLEVARNASQAAETTMQAKHKAVDGAGVVGKVVAGIGNVMTQAQELKTDMNILGKQAEGISQVMTVINDIADQTNLLALNAAIEAARAGEAGRGFAVVADEVRKLAEKTMSATKEVGDAISGIQQGTKKNVGNVENAGRLIEEATALANKSGDALKEIVGLVDLASDQVRSIATAAEEQSAASEEINKSIEDINRISADVSNAMRQSAQAVGELAQQAHVLNGLIDELKFEGCESGFEQAALPK